jgi:hypothetical protein
MSRLTMESILALLQRKLSIVAIVAAIRHSTTTDNDVDDDSISNNFPSSHFV